MSLAVERKSSGLGLGALRPPLLVVAGAFALTLVILSLPISLPIGPMYWDAYIYYDAASRIFSGQIPVVDFFTPAGPLGYYLFAGFLSVFPNGQSALMAHWSLLPLTLPMLAVVLWQVDGRSRLTAWALLIPFLVFALLPFNGREFYPFPGSDAFGIYNRQVCQVLYVLVAALLFVRDGRLLALLVATVMTMLFFLKITGFLAAGLICAYALLAGRLSLRQAVAAAAGFALVLAASEWACGMVSHYLAAVATLVAMNSGGLVSRLVQSVSINIDVVGVTAALALVLVWTGRERLREQFGALRRQPGLGTLAVLADNDFAWLAVLIAAGVFFEAQNTGSQAFIFLWPALWVVLCRALAAPERSGATVAAVVLVAAAFLPMTVGVLERAARTYAGALNTVPFESRNLKTLGQVAARDHVMRRAEAMLAFYPRHRDALDAVAAGGELPSALLYSDFDFQIAHLMAADRAVDAIRAFESRTGVRFETIMTVSFTNIFPYLMDRGAPRLVSIGADPFRTVPVPSEAVAAELARVDIALYPKCPDTIANKRIWEIYGPALAGHRRIELDDCFDAYLRPDLAARLD